MMLICWAGACSAWDLVVMARMLSTTWAGVTAAKAGIAKAARAAVAIVRKDTIFDKLTEEVRGKRVFKDMNE